MPRLPSLFLSHGAPSIALDDSPARRFLTNLGEMAPKPRAIVIFSAHYDVSGARVTTGHQPDTIHDFRGFADALYDLHYPAPGNSDLAQHIVSLLNSTGITAEADPGRGFDHGAWIPMLLAYPEADIPLIQVSIDSTQSPAYHQALGAAIKPLRDEGVLIIGSGSTGHNLRVALRAQPNDPPPDWVQAFDDWVARALLGGNRRDLLDYAAKAPYAHQNHPTPDHFLPLFCALGAADADESATRMHHSYSHAVLAMDAYGFGLHQTKTHRA